MPCEVRAGPEIGFRQRLDHRALWNGSAAARLSKLSPLAAKSVHGDMSAAAAGKAMPRALSARISETASPPPAESPTSAMRQASRPLASSHALAASASHDVPERELCGSHNRCYGELASPANSPALPQ